MLSVLQDRIAGGVYSDGQPLPSGRQLAEELQVDRGTVMRVMESLRREGRIRQVSPRIHVATPSAAGNSSLSLVGQSVALVSLGTRYHPGHRQPGWVEFISLGALPAIEDAGMHALSFHPARLREQGVEQLIDAKPYGVIFTDLLTETGEDEMLRQLHDAGVPFVVYGDGETLADYDRVSSDHERGGYELTRWLIGRGRKHILCFWQEPTDTPWLADRYRGYERAMKEAGLAPMPIATHPGIEAPRDRAAFDRAIRLTTGYLAEHLVGPEPIDALMLTSDGETPYAAAACRLLQREPNRDVELVGYDHYWADAPERKYEDTPPLATIDKRNMVMGQTLVELLSDRVAGNLPAQPQRRVVKPVLIESSNPESALDSSL